MLFPEFHSSVNPPVGTCAGPKPEPVTEIREQMELGVDADGFQRLHWLASHLTLPRGRMLERKTQ